MDIPYGDKVESAEILEEGKPAIVKLANYLKDIETDVNFTSPYKRCIQTSGIVSEVTGKVYEIDVRLRDWDPRVESLPEHIKRLDNYCNELQTMNHELNTVSICTHGYPINAVIAYFTKGRILESELPNFPAPGILVTIRDKKLSYKDFNS